MVHQLINALRVPLWKEKDCLFFTPDATSELDSLIVAIYAKASSRWQELLDNINSEKTQNALVQRECSDYFLVSLRGFLELRDDSPVLALLMLLNAMSTTMELGILEEDISSSLLESYPVAVDELGPNFRSRYPNANLVFVQSVMAHDDIP